MNIVTNELINVPKRNIPLESTPKTDPEIPNTVNIARMIPLTSLLPNILPLLTSHLSSRRQNDGLCDCNDGSLPEAPLY